MAWVARKFDSLAGAVFAALGGIACSQLQAFIQQYLQRLGGQLDEAQRHLGEVIQTERYRGLDPHSRRLLIDSAQERIADIQQAYNAIRDADGLVRPFAFLSHFDAEVALRVVPDFQPALPLDAASLIYAGAGLVLGLVVWELVKLPVGVMTRKRG